MEKWDGGGACISAVIISVFFSPPRAQKRHTHKPLQSTQNKSLQPQMPAVAKVFPPPAIFLVTQSPNSVHKDSSSSLLQATGLGLPLPKNQEINSGVCTGPSWHLYHRKWFLNICGCDLQIQVWAQSDYYCKPVTKQYLRATSDSKAHLLLRATRWVTLRDQHLTWLILWAIEYLSPTWWSACLIDFSSGCLLSR